MDTGARKWGRPYLTRAFFSLLGERMGERVAADAGAARGPPFAGALNFIGGDACTAAIGARVEDHPFLHFELCYYQAIDCAIAHGSRASKPARRGSTSWRAAMCR